uniref:Ig-like domain-containing protein n=1 Tax=Pelusios castaneus TaxID=367368 RepID=A0A8C8RYV5_9SAUR
MYFLSLLPAGRCLKRVSNISVLQHPAWAVKEAGASVEMNCTLELPQGYLRPSRVLVAWHRGRSGNGLMGMGKISEAEELQGRVVTTWLEKISASILHIHNLQQNDSALYLCLFVIFPSAQPCLLEGNGTRLTVTGMGEERV